MPSSTVENYLKQMYLSRGGGRGQAVTTGQLASAMGVTPGTATAMVKALADAGLVEHQLRAGVKLTLRGEKLALHVLRRHRLVELFLVEKLGFNWAEVHEEAEALEHAVSERVLERLDALLGHPAFDPHGDPIPDRHGQIPAAQQARLADCAVGGTFQVGRVLDQDPEFLNFAAHHGLVPRAQVTVQKREPAAGALTVQTARHAAVSLSFAAAEKILVAPVA